MALSALMSFSLLTFFDFWSWVILEFKFSGMGSLEMSLSFYFDWMSCLFGCFVLMISSCVLFYSIDYMSGDRRIFLFLILIVLFVVSMLMVIFSLNMVSIMLGWDGLGLVSYLLVIYYNNFSSSSAGMITALSNRLGDAGIMLSLAVLVDYGSWEFMSWLASCEEINSILFVFVILAATTKSAQIPFSAWLPAAMAAPTPVSALVHSSTLVTAGVYLMIRFSPLMPPSFKLCLLIFGLSTLIMSSVGAVLETDLKKIVALSTLSQLGLMFISLSLAPPEVCFFHLLTHATFKALLFMCSGEVIHESLGSQDIRFMGGAMTALPFTSTSMNVSNFALCGFPFMAGFYSKDMIIEVGVSADCSYLLYFSLFLGVSLSSVYSARMVFLSMVEFTSQPSLYSSLELSSWMMKSKIILISLAIFGGCALAWLIFPSPCLIVLPLEEKLTTLFSVLVGAVLGFYLSYYLMLTVSARNKNMGAEFFMNMWFLSSLSGLLSCLLSSMVARLYSLIDSRWLEDLVGGGSSDYFREFQKITLSFQLMSVKSYISVFVVLILFGLFMI
uniref:NADH-ubiquinone oxidoreductase chain 5 n=1 Tax=Pleurocryptella fimbriata TaxID=2480055 RepID=A0A8K1Y3K4_9CRUS|nr:NADH dehydrogenase subunit 5 [Pleurocryptella fimbriata]